VDRVDKREHVLGTGPVELSTSRLTATSSSGADRGSPAGWGRSGIVRLTQVAKQRWLALFFIGLSTTITPDSSPSIG
jgi:hypothetical protein